MKSQVTSDKCLYQSNQIIYCFLRFDMMELDRSSRFTHDGTVSREPLSADKDAATAVADEVPAENLDAARIPLRLKIIAVLLVSSIGFGSHWSSGVTSAMKSTLKKVSRVSRS